MTCQPPTKSEELLILGDTAFLCPKWEFDPTPGCGGSGTPLLCTTPVMLQGEPANAVHDCECHVVPEPTLAVTGLGLLVAFILLIRWANR